MDGMMNEATVEEIQYIVIRIGDEQYGINIGYVDNIVRMQRITRGPKSQPYYVGVINLRGEVVPVMSLRKRFGLEMQESSGAKLDEKNAAYLAGIGKKGDTLISLLNIENVVGDTKTA